MTNIADFSLDPTIRQTNPRILLDSGPPRALYKINPRNILGKDWWDERRREAYRQFLNCCAACGVSQVRLEAHELYKIDKKKGKVYLDDVVPLCEKCHSFVHQDLHRALLKKGALTTDQVKAILKHGHTVLKHHNIRYNKKDPNSGPTLFHNWRLVLNGKEYGPVFEENK